jgi:hypothetical protein
MKFLLILALCFGITSVYAADPTKAVQNDTKSKSVQKQTAPKKNCDMLKDKNCNKAAPSANKPIPKKKSETK